MGSYTEAFFDPERGRAAQSAGRPRPALVAVLRGPQCPGLRHHGRGAHSAAEGHGRSVLGHGRAAVVLQRRGRLVGTGRAGQPGARRAPAQDEPQGARRSHGGDGRAVDRGPGQPENRLERARHAHRAPRGDGGPGGQRTTVLHPGVDRGGSRKRFPVPDVPGRPAREFAGPDLHLAGDRGERAAVAGAGRGTPDLGDPGRTADASPGAEPAAGARREPPVRRLFCAGRAGRLGAAGPVRAKRRGNDFRALRHENRVRRTGPGHRAMVGRQPRAKRDRGSRRRRELRGRSLPGQRHAHAEARASVARAAVGDHAIGEPHRVHQTPRPLPGRPGRAQVRKTPESVSAVRAEESGAANGPCERCDGRGARVGRRKGVARRQRGSRRGHRRTGSSAIGVAVRRRCARHRWDGGARGVNARNAIGRANGWTGRAGGSTGIGGNVRPRNRTVREA